MVIEAWLILFGLKALHQLDSGCGMTTQNLLYAQPVSVKHVGNSK